jgi:hypothetical protein
MDTEGSIGQTELSDTGSVKDILSDERTLTQLRELNTRLSVQGRNHDESAVAEGLRSIIERMRNRPFGTAVDTDSLVTFWEPVVALHLPGSILHPLARGVVCTRLVEGLGSPYAELPTDVLTTAGVIRWSQRGFDPSVRSGIVDRYEEMGVAIAAIQNTYYDDKDRGLVRTEIVDNLGNALFPLGPRFSLVGK